MAEETKKEAKEETKGSEEKQEKKETKLSAEVKKILEKISGLKPEDKKALGLEIVKGLTVLELSEWVKSMEEEFGVTAAAPVAAFGAVPGAGAAAEPEEEKTSFNVVLTSIGDKKIQVIKEVRAVTSLGLKEAKELVESAPTAIKEDVSKEEAEEIKKKIEAVGATVEIK